jgi:DNA invertase Pin-like site-specific DNA recombinase
MERKDTENKRYICLVRASDTSEGTTSTEAQLALLKDYGQRMGMIYVDAIVLDGVTGSRPGNREDLDGLLARKREKNDFDVLLVQRLDRLTRGGSSHGLWFQHECDRVGLRVVFVGDDIPVGRYANLIKVAKFDAAQEQAISISQRSTQGSQLALAQGRNITSAHTPFGCWRLYLTTDGKPSHIIADLRDGRQQKLDPETRAVTDTYGQIGGGGKGHYRKQKNERVLLIPGADAEVAVVREIFDLHFRQGMGGKRIADILNRRGVLSVQRKSWSQHQVEVIYRLEVYTGRSVGNRTSSAIYHERQESAPKRVELDAAVQATAKNIPVRQRPRAEWFVQEQPKMETFLDPEVRKLAMVEHERIWRERGDPDRPKRSMTKHQASEYLLTGLLHAKQDGEALAGVLCGRVGHKVRYYRHRRGNRDYVKGGIFSRMIQAQPLEDAVLNLVAQVVAADDGLRQRIMGFIESEIQKTTPGAQLVELQERRERIRRKTALIVSNLDDETLADAREELDRLKTERRTLDEQIAAAEAASAMQSVDPAAIADAVVAQLHEMAAQANDMPTFALRALVKAIVGRVIVDMETKAVEVELTLTSDLPLAVQDGIKPMRLAATSASSSSYETHQRIRIDLGRIDCAEDRIGGRPCYQCQRRAA